MGTIYNIKNDSVFFEHLLVEFEQWQTWPPFIVKPECFDCSKIYQTN